MLYLIRNQFRMTKQPPLTTSEFFKFGRMLGKGAFGKVHLAMHKLVRKCLAIKVIPKDELNDKVKSKLLWEVGILK